jgi:DNA-binding CsgD family transcriptional regulator
MGRESDPPSERRDEQSRRTVTLLFANIAAPARRRNGAGGGAGGPDETRTAVVRAALGRNGGIEVGRGEDGFLVVFGSAYDAVAAAVEAQRAATRDRRLDGAEVQLRTGVVTCEARCEDGRYVGLDVERARRIAAAAGCGGVVLSASSRSLVAADELPGVAFRDLGTHHLDGVDGEEHLFELVLEGPPAGAEPERDAGRPAAAPEPWDQGVVGRADELASVAQFVERLPEGPGVLVLDGPAGIGKTTVWRAAGRLASERSHAVLSCAPGPADAELPFTALGDLLHAVLGETLPHLPPPQRRALEIALLVAQPAGAPPDQRAVSVAVLGTLRLLARHRSVLLAIDDAHWVDLASARVLEFALRRLDGAPVGVVATHRSGEHVPIDLGRAFGGRPPQRLTVSPLALDTLDGLLRSQLGTSFGRPTLVELQRTSGGNPLFALEIGRALLRRERPFEPGESLPVPKTLQELIGERVGGLPGETRQALRVAAALSEPTLPLVEAVAPGALDALPAAVEAGILELSGPRLRFTHPLLAAVLLAEMSPPSRRRLHGRLADVVADDEERARHLAAATDAPDPAVSLVLEEAARRAHARAAPQAAAAFAEHARRLTPRARRADVARRSISAAEYALQAGDPGRARALLEDVVARSPPGRLRATALHRLATVHALEESSATAAAILTRALAEGGIDTRLRVCILVDLVLDLQQTGELQRAHEHATTAVALAESLSEAGLLAAALTNLALTAFLLGHGVRSDLMEQAVAFADEANRMESVERASRWHPEVMWATMLKWADDFDAAREKLQHRHRQALELHEEPWLAPVLFQLGELECWCGNWELAARYAREGRAAAEQSGEPMMEMLSIFLDALIDAYAGRIEQARASVEDALRRAESTSNNRFLIRCLAALGFVELSVGDAAAAHRHLGRARELSAAAGYGEPGVVRFEADEIEALLALGRLDDAQTLVEELEERGRMLDRPWALATSARCRGLLLAARGDLDGAIVALEGALASHRRLPQPFELARTLLALGIVLRRARKKRLARETLQDACEIFERLGTPLWGEKARGELARIGGRPPAPDALSATEERVAEQVASGATNREVAATLFMSAKTVERHLTHIFQKLGVESRRELRTRARTGGEKPARTGHGAAGSLAVPDGAEARRRTGQTAGDPPIPRRTARSSVRASSSRMRR